ncbi:MAG: biosynthetic-type acetolactate synthase large subunit [Planctomycetota bacterium]
METDRRAKKSSERRGGDGKARWKARTGVASLGVPAGGNGCRSAAARRSRAAVPANAAAPEASGAEMVIRTLEALGAEHVFGYPGGAIMPVYDALLEARKLRHILSRHEQGAAHMADGYARATGRVGVCFATSGPGATNLITGIATAYMDSSPLVAITGQVASQLIGTDAFQEADVFGLSCPVTKHSYLVRSVEEIPRSIAEAFHIARTGRPGPVLVDIPKNFQLGRAPFRMPEELDLPGYRVPGKAAPEEIEAIVDAIRASRRPVLYVGGGAISASASEVLLKFVAQTGIPVAMTLMGLGAIPRSHPASLGMLGMHGSLYANRAVQESDLLIAAGARFDDRVTGKVSSFAPRAKVVHIDADPSEHSKIVRAHISVCGDVRLVLGQILERMEDEKVEIDIAPWRARIDAWKRAYPLPLGHKARRPGCLSPRRLIEEIASVAGEDAIVTTDVGQHQMWAAQYYPVSRPHSWITSGGLGTMGFGFPAAIGAKIAFPDRPVICLTGDGSIQMNIQELTTAVSRRLGIVVAIFDNQALGMVRQWQRLFHSKRYSSTDLYDNPDFVKVAEAFGGRGEAISEPDEVAPAVRKALERDVPTFLRCRIDHDEHVFPIVPAGGALDEAILRPGD